MGLLDRFIRFFCPKRDAVYAPLISSSEAVYRNSASEQELHSRVVESLSTKLCPALEQYFAEREEVSDLSLSQKMIDLSRVAVRPAELRVKSLSAKDRRLRQLDSLYASIGQGQKSNLQLVVCQCLHACLPSYIFTVRISHVEHDDSGETFYFDVQQAMLRQGVFFADALLLNVRCVIKTMFDTAEVALLNKKSGQVYFRRSIQQSERMRRSMSACRN